MPHIEIKGMEYHFVVCERSTEFERKTTTDFNEIIFWIFEGMTSSIACKLELKKQNRKRRFQNSSISGSERPHFKN